MAYKGITPGGNPADDHLYSLFQRDTMQSLEQGAAPAWQNYDEWYNKVIKPQLPQAPQAKPGGAQDIASKAVAILQHLGLGSNRGLR